MLGGALGDALGEPVEFISSAHEILRCFGANAPAKLGYAHGPFITDDTQMTLFAAEGMIRAGRVRWDDHASLARSVQAGFLRWYSTQRGSDSEVVASSPAGWLVTQRGLHHQRAPGNTCMSALQAQVGAKKLASVASPLNSSKGCGAIMRAAPFGLAARTRAQAFQWGRDTGAITHGHPSGYLSAGHFAAVIWGISRGEPLATSIEQATALLAGEANHAETSAAVSRAMSLVANGPPSPSTIESLGGAWVGEEALAIALLCTATCEGSSPEAIAESLWRAVAHAGDSDSTGSMVGNLLGAMHGYEALPAAWLEELELVGVIDRIAGDLLAALAGKVDERAYPVEQADMRASADEPEKKIEWHGILSREVCSEWFLQARDALADAAKASDWPGVFRVLEEHPKLINSWRAGGKSWYAPLHQAAHGGASVDIVERLLSLGAWRTLANAKGERPVDIARRQGHDHLVPQLEPVAVRRVDAQALERMQRHFHSVIRTRVAVLEGVADALRLPELAPLTEYPNARAWFAVPGMYGGFSFWLEADGAQPKLVTESWCRVVEGSEERHEVTPGGARLVIGRP